MTNVTTGPRQRTPSRCLLFLALFCGCVFSIRAAASSPILILTNAADAFSQYYEQMVLTEGLNEYALGNIASVTNGMLAQYDVAILAPTALTSAQVTSISNWVYGGGTLVAMRPDKQLAGLLGLVDAGTNISEGYLLVNTNTGPGAGIVNQTMQFHGAADAYALGGATSLATLYSDAVTPTVYPAVSVQNVGPNGGQAAAFTFDLARSIAFMRQGNPAWTDQFRDSLSPTRPDDLFYGPASFDPEPNWVDFNKIAIPQADEQQRFLANLIISLDSSKRLLPRFWYFPHGYRAVVMMGGDDHANGGTAGRFDQYLAYSPTNGTVADWTAIRGTSYIFTEPTLLSNTQAAAYNADGFEIGLHLNTGCSTYNFASLDAFFTNQLSLFTNTYTSLPPPVTQRIHCIAWSGYTTAPQDELLHGMRLDATYYYYPPNWVNDQPGLFTGSAMPMRYVTTNGNLIDVFQAAVQMTDESGQTYPKTVNALLDGALGPQEYYGAYAANMHTDYADNPGSDLIVMAAINRGVPVISSRQLLTWLDARNASSMGSISWANKTLTFSVGANSNATGLQVMVPVPAGLSVSNVTYNGGPTGYFLRGVKGMQYAFINALTGNYAVTFQTDSTPPVVTSVLPTNGATAVAQTANVTITFNEALNQATINTNTISLLNATNGLVPATISYNPATFTAVLTPNNPLALATSYTVTVNGAGGITDVAGNPMAGSFTSSLATIPQIDYSIWTNTAEPAVASVEDTNSIEVGMKFQSAVSGYITGVRFFKGCFDKGVHIGNLWTTNGTLLASVTFSNETFAGWQSQAFAAPVPVSPNTTYVVSCFKPLGGYPSDVGYFAGSAYTNYPLYALADGQSGGNGLYAYSASSTFPNQSFQAENFWVDVTFDPGNALVITTPSLPDGILGVPYSTNLTASGGTLPYHWALINGSLPSGLNLNTNSGAITGTSTTTGTFNFTVQASDASMPVEIATRSLSLNIQPLPSNVTIFPASAVPGVPDSGPDSSVELGVKFRTDVPGFVTGIRFYKAAANTGAHLGDLWTTNGTLLNSATFSGETASGWQQVNFALPVPISANTVYVASYHCNNGHYSADDNYFLNSGVDNPPLHALANGVSGPDGVYAYGSGSIFPNQGFNADNYWVDIAFTSDLGIILPAQTNRVINELTTLTVANTALDTAIPTNTLVYSLTVTSLGTGSGESGNSTVTNASISTNGVISWTPGQTQSPSTNLFTTVASDGTYSATNSFTVTVLEVNIAPVLPNQTNITVSGLTPIVVTNTAGEPNIHSVTVGYRLTGPAGSTIDTNGVIRWTPVVGQVPGVYPFTTVATNSNPYDLINPQLTATNSFTVTVNAVHNTPVLPLQTNRVINELTLLVVTNTASENDVPPLALTYSLTVTNLGNNSGVTNASISTNGVITWTPQQAQSPGTNRFMTVVSDGSLKATNSFLVTVLEVNAAPVLPGQTDVTSSGLTPVVVTNTAGEPNIHSVTVGYGLTGPVGSTIDTNGVIRWTPVVGQVPGVYPFTTVATNSNPYDLINPQLTATNSFTVTVNAVHNTPVLPLQTNRVINELTLLVVTNTASENDVPPLPLTYSLTVTNLGSNSAVTNASISANGVITWMPQQTQSPSTNAFITVVSDGSLSATNSFLVTVLEVNQAPVLPGQTNLTISGLTAIVVTNTAGEPNLHSVTVGYGLTGPAGSTIDTNGVIRWTPEVGQVPGLYPFTTVVTNSNPYDLINPQLTATNSFTVTVQAVHNGPVLPLQTNQVINELTLLTVTNTASDNDIPSLALTYSLTVTNLGNNSAVTNASISTNGVITWTSQQTQSPSTNAFVTVVSDGSLSATNSFMVTVLEVNQAPVLPGQTDVTISGTTPIVVTNTAGESNIHSVTTGYGLAGPTGATIDTNGVIRWTPAVGQVPGVYPFTTVVTNSNPYDLINPQLTATNSFTVTVQAVHNGPVLPLQTNQVINELTLLTVTNTASDNDIPSLALTYSLTVTNLGNNSVVTNASINTNGVITWTPQQTQSPGTNRFTTVVSDGSLKATNSFMVTVLEVNVAPVLPGQTDVTISGTTPIVVTNTAGEPNIHSVTAGYGLTGPVGSTIDTNGVIRWTPVAGQVPGVYPFTTVATNSNPYDLINPQLTATNSFTVTVQAVHNGPVLPNQTNVAVNELTLLTVTNTATDTDIPSLALTYSLTVTNLGNNSVVTNASISTNGVITWTPQQTQSPGTNRFTTVVSDGSLKATNSFLVTVLEVNAAPVLPSQTDVTSSGLTPVVVTNTAGEPNLHSVTLGYGLTGPVGSTIDTNGVIRWTPAVGQVPGVYPFTTVVTNSNPYDLINPQLTATNSFTVTVQAVHNGPMLPNQTNVAVNELTLLTVTNTATDTDIPSLALTYSLTVTNLGNNSAVTNASISTNGVITWTPQQTQSPGTNRFTTVVSDGSLSATNSFMVTVLEVNVAPVLPNQTNLTISGMTPIVVTNTAGEPNLHSVTLGYGLTGPVGSTIDTNGVIRWTPVVGQVPGVYPFTTVVTNSNPYDLINPQLTATNSFTVTVQAVHNTPVLPLQTNRVINELTLLVVTNTASENDVPPLALTYSLTVTNLGNNSTVTNASISTNGVITWTPQQVQSPGTNRFMTVVSDGSLKATNSFLVTVLEVNAAPVLPGQTDVTSSGLTPVVVTNTAGEPNIHSVTVGYGLTGPVGSTIDTNGVIRWTPAVGQVPGVYPFTTVVTNSNPYDLINPQLTATNRFTVTVTAIHNGPMLPNQSNVSITEQTLLVVTNTAIDNDVPPLPLTYALVNPPAGAVISTNGVITWTPSQAQAPGSDVITTIVSDGTYQATNNFTVTVNVATNDFRILSITTSNGVATVTWTSVPGNYYRLEYKDSLTAPVWSDVTPDVQATGQTTALTNTLGSATQRFFRVMLVPNGPNLRGQSNQVINELTTLVVTNTAVDHDLPPLLLTYSLMVTNVAGGSAVTNASISTNGVITWTPLQAQSPGTNRFTTVVSDGSLSATNSFMVTVLEVNVAPVLLNQTNLTISGMTPIVVTNTAGEPNLHSVTVGYGLTGPAGSTIDTNGVIRWTPAVGQVPGVYPFTTVVTNSNPYDLINPQLTATNRFTVTVTAIHNGPMLPNQSNVSITEQTLLVVTNTAIDNDVPPLPLTYALVNPPAGAVISTNGVITWTPSQAQAPGSDVITTIVSDGTYQATNNFTVTVNVATNDFRILSITTTNGVATVTWTSVPGNYYRLEYKDSLTAVDWNNVTPDVQATNQTASTTNVLGGATQRFFRVMLVEAANVPQPVIQSVSLTNGVATVVWTALPPHVYRLQFNGNPGSTNWNAVIPDVTATGLTAIKTDTVGVSTQRFYRIFVVQ